MLEVMVVDFAVYKKIDHQNRHLGGAFEYNFYPREGGTLNNSIFKKFECHGTGCHGGKGMLKL